MQMISSVPISSRLEWNQPGSIAVLGADNMGYYTRNAQARVDADGKMSTHTWIDTINWWQRWDLPLHAKFKSSDQFFARIKDIDLLKKSVSLSSHNMHTSFNNAFSHSSSQISQKLTLLDRPNNYSISSACIEYQSPFFDLKTSKTQDMEIFLNNIYCKYICMLIIFCRTNLIFDPESSLYTAVIVMSDEHFIDRLLGILREHASFFGTILPFPGIFLDDFWHCIHFSCR